MTLTDFLLARIADDEAAVPEWMQRVVPGSPIGDWIRQLGERVLTECAAKRRIVEAYQEERSRAEVMQRAVGDETRPADRDMRIRAWARQRGLEVAVEALASTYADHPDYRPEWA